MGIPCLEPFLRFEIQGTASPSQAILSILKFILQCRKGTIQAQVPRKIHLHLARSRGKGTQRRPPSDEPQRPGANVTLLFGKKRR